MTNTPKAVVMGRNYTSLLGMIRAVGEAGCDVTVIKTVKKIPAVSLKTLIKGKPPESVSKYVTDFLYAVEPDEKALIALLTSRFTPQDEKTVLIPTDDFTAKVIDKYQELLKDTFVFPNIESTPGAVLHIMDKNVQKQLAIAAGLKVAEGWPVKIENGQYTVPQEIKYPCFTKPQISFLGNKTYMKCCRNENELRETLDTIAKRSDCPVLVEEFVEIEREFAVLGFSDGENIVLPGIIELLETGHGYHKGVTLLGEIMPIDEFSGLGDILRVFVKQLNFTGLFDIDLYFGNGTVYFNELNMRFGASGYAVTHEGINLPLMLINTLLGRKNDFNNSTIKEHKYFLNNKVNIEDYSDGFITWAQYKENIAKADFTFAESANDPEPYKAFKRHEFLHKIRRFIKSIR